MNSPLQQDGKRIPIKELVLYAALAALLLTVQVGLAFLPNIELVSLLLIIYARVIGKKALYPLYVFVFVEGLVYGFGIWWINYLYIWAILVFLTLILQKTCLKKEDSVLLWAVFSAVYGLLFGTLSSIPYLFIGGLSLTATYIINGIPFDLLHCGGNLVVALILIKPLHRLMQRLVTKYEIM